VTEELTTRGRRARVLATVAGLVLLLAGTFYSTSPDPNGDARDTRVEGVDETGRTVVINEANSGIRRAEIEGQQADYQADPSRLSRIAEAYAEHTPNAPALREVRIVVRWHGIEDARPTGTYRDEIIADWIRP
jgi:hypothetical protein